MDILLYPFVWLSRIFHCLGFGIQSPTDYRFVRYVVNEHAPYYKYEEVGRYDDWLTRRLGRLYLRMANWLQPKVVVATKYEAYLKAGCEKCNVADDAKEVEMVIVSTANEIERLLPRCSDRSVMVLDRMHQHSALWRQICNSPSVTITFDLYYCGIAFFDSKRSKQHYIINF
jgi:hypothetical protein